jgi:formate C-acetyltransferase
MEDFAAHLSDASQPHAWRAFRPGRWQNAVDVRDFIVRNVTPYEGDDSFLVGPSRRTQAVWGKLQPYFEEERHKGVLDVDAATPSTMLAHQPGWIDRETCEVVR